MSVLLEAVFLTFIIAGAAIPTGGFLAKVEMIRPPWLEAEFRHSVLAFGGGALIAAVALVLVPEGRGTLCRFIGSLSVHFRRGCISRSGFVYGAQPDVRLQSGCDGFGLFA